MTVGFYLVFSAHGGFLGFPLDDAWIHQTYARNLATRGQFAFVPDQPSAGSTSPLWTGVIALGYWARVDYRLWTYGMGVLLLALNGWLVCRQVLALWPERRLAAWLAGIFTVFEWHLAWAAVSGMETLLFSALALAVFSLWHGRHERGTAWRVLAVGVGAGLAVWARPDGLSLLPFGLAGVTLKPKLAEASNQVSDDQRQKPVGGSTAVNRQMACYLKYWVIMGMGVGSVFIPYLLFNYALNGVVWPNTYYAKQAEYAVMLLEPLWWRGWQVARMPFVGALVMLLPGIAAAVWHAGDRRRRWTVCLPLAWTCLYLVMYAARLPLTYQHGRYLMPVIPVLTAIGLGGMWPFVRLAVTSTSGLFCSKSRRSLDWRRLLGRVWLAATAIILFAFWGLGAAAYCRDVQFIETEMVRAAHWIRQNTPAEALVAAHDIGALGYFGQRQILDLAGLISPEVIPFIRDVPVLGKWIAASGASYVVVFPSWYPGLTSYVPATVVYSTNAPFASAMGFENIIIYEINR